MKINQPDNSDDFAKTIADLQAWLDQPLPHQQPVCPNCGEHRPMSCSAQCADAPASLSVDPVAHPIEPNVLPIVFQLYATRLLQPCWSCEGHVREEAGKQSLWKLPQVHFYCQTPVYLQLLNRGLARLQAAESFSYQWQIVLADFTQEVHVTYTIEPKLTDIEHAELSLLQADLLLLAKNFTGMLQMEAEQMIQQLKKQQQQTVAKRAS